MAPSYLYLTHKLDSEPKKIYYRRIPKGMASITFRFIRQKKGRYFQVVVYLLAAVTFRWLKKFAQ